MKQSELRELIHNSIQRPVRAELQTLMHPA